MLKIVFDRWRDIKQIWFVNRAKNTYLYADVKMLHTRIAALKS